LLDHGSTFQGPDEPFQHCARIHATLEQRVIADFMAASYFARHLKRMRALMRRAAAHWRMACPPCSVIALPWISGPAGCI